MRQGRATVVPSLDEIRLQVDSRGEIADRKRCLSGGDLGTPPVKVGNRIIRYLPYDFSEQRDRPCRYLHSNASGGLPNQKVQPPGIIGEIKGGRCTFRADNIRCVLRRGPPAPAANASKIASRTIRRMSISQIVEDPKGLFSGLTSAFCP